MFFLQDAGAPAMTRSDKVLLDFEKGCVVLSLFFVLFFSGILKRFCSGFLSPGFLRHRWSLVAEVAELLAVVVLEFLPVPGAVFTPWLPGGAGQ